MMAEADPARALAAAVAIQTSSGGQTNQAEEAAQLTKVATKQTSALSNSKDKAQATATSAMAIVQVALLRKVIDNGPEDNLYYEASIGLIIASLVLQIIAGIITIFTGNMTSYFNKSGGNVVKDCWANICCCKIVGKKGAHKKKTFGLRYASDGTTPIIPADDGEDEISSDGCCSCCPWECSGEVLSGHELDTIQTYENWQRQQMQLSLATEAARMEREQLAKLIDEAKDQLRSLEADTSTDPSVVREQGDEIQKTIDEAIKKKTDYEMMILDKTISDSQGEILKEKVKSIRKTRVFKTATFWMHILQWILYTVFILQAFIAGLTIVDSSGGGGNQTVTGIITTTTTIAPVVPDPGAPPGV